MKFICIGRNYKEHAAELNNPVPTEPVVFLKPETAQLKSRNPFFIPSFANEFHHEIEVLVKICKVGKNIEERFAHRYYEEIGVGIDFTARDLQDELKKKGQPWEKAKGFDSSAFISEFVPKENFKDLQNLNFHLDINGVLRQKGNTQDMIFSIDFLISYLSKYFTLKTGDIIFTGTPAGVGKVETDDVLDLYLEDQLMAQCRIK